MDPKLRLPEDIQLMGDQNINLLNYKNHGDTMQYLDTLFSYQHLPLITLPTRITPTSATVIDSITTTHKADFYDAGIIEASLSDHLPVFYLKDAKFSNPPPKYIKTRKINETIIPPFS